MAVPEAVATSRTSRGLPLAAQGGLGPAEADAWEPVRHQGAAGSKAREAAAGDTAGGGGRGTGSGARSRGQRGPLGWIFGEALGRELALLLVLLVRHLGEGSVTLKKQRG